MNIDKVLRANIKALKPYASARDEYTGAEAIFLDANENPFNAPYNRYPDPYQQKVKEKVAKLKGIAPEHIFLGNGSDEPIDILFRAFCEPAIDNVISIHPSYGMYQVCADINNVKIKKVLLTPDFELDADAVLAEVDSNTKLIFLCSPNNPTANALSYDRMLQVIQGFQGIVVLDEAYIDFCADKSLLPELLQYPNLVILQTFSKAWGMAGIRLGMAFASDDIVTVFNKIKYPYNINITTQQLALKLLDSDAKKNGWVELLLKERELLASELTNLPFVETIYPSDANFLLVKMKGAKSIFDYLISKQIILRDRSRLQLCEGAIRITVGAQKENALLLEALKAYVEKGPDNDFVVDEFVDLTAVLSERRVGKVQRTTKETDIFVQIDLDGTGKTEISTGLGFFDHMLDQIGKHSLSDLIVKVNGDLEVDEHHTIEDTALALGEAVLLALGDKRGIERYGFCLPMDDCLVQVAIDFGGRPWLVWDATFNREKIGDMPTEMFLHFFKSFSDAAKCNLNVKAEGDNEHHKIEGVFKALARAIKMAKTKDPNSNELPSTKGIL